MDKLVLLEQTLLLWLLIIAYAAESMTAALAAGRRSMDWMGVCLLGSITALGGGSMRDVLLGHHPLVWVKQPWLLLLTWGAAASVIALAPLMHRLRAAFLVLDAIGLVIFTIVGCEVALHMNQPLLIVILAGMISGCVGGVLRDVLCNDVPLLFRSELYASASVVTGALYVAGLRVGLNQELVTILVFAVGLTFGYSRFASAGRCRSSSIRTAGIDSLQRCCAASRAAKFWVEAGPRFGIRLRRRFVREYEIARVPARCIRPDS